MTTQEVKAAIRESLGLPAKPEPVPTVPQEGHVCDFPIWTSSSKWTICSGEIEVVQCLALPRSYNTRRYLYW